jgi:hypothetical protein
MMKRILIFAVLLLAPALLLAQSADRDVLLTPDGTLYSIESQFATDKAPSTNSSSRILLLNVQQGDKAETIYVPASLTGGMHSSPSLAYDSTSKTLFVFWQKMPSLMSSELLFCSYKDGVWSEPASIDNAPFHFRFNLRIGITRVADDTDAEGKAASKPFLAVHAVWWDQSGYGENARYAIIALKDGQVSNIQIHDLLEYVDANDLGDVFALPTDYDREIFRHPGIFEQPGRASIEVVFADWDRNRLHKVDLMPITQNGVLHLPIGVRGATMDPPGRVNREASTSVSIMQSSSASSLLFYFEGDKKLQYVMYRGGAWSDLTTVPLGDSVSMETAVEALRKLASSE